MSGAAPSEAAEHERKLRLLKKVLSDLAPEPQRFLALANQARFVQERLRRVL